MQSGFWASRVRAVVPFLMVLLAMAPAWAKDKESTQAVDSGAFGVFANGRRVATETFSIEQVPGGSLVTAQVKTEGNTSPAQSSELRLTAGGDLVRYEWHDLGPNKSSLVVTPNEQFLIEKVSTNNGDKPAEQPFLMPTSTMVLDNNFFVQRQLLVWRYLGSSCKHEEGKTQCPTTPAEFGVLVPQDRTSMRVSLQLVGREKVKVGAAERDLLRLTLKDDTNDWALWVDDQNSFKLMRIVVAANSTEVVRE